MSNNKKKNKKTEKSVKIVLAVVVAILLLILGVSRENIENIFGMKLVSENVQTTENNSNQSLGTKEQTAFDKVTIETGNNVISEIKDKSGSKIYFFDVGQADSILIVNNAETMLIDAGNNDDGETVVNYIKTWDF